MPILLTEKIKTWWLSFTGHIHGLEMRVSCSISRYFHDATPPSTKLEQWQTMSSLHPKMKSSPSTLLCRLSAKYIYKYMSVPQVFVCIQFSCTLRKMANVHRLYIKLFTNSFGDSCYGVSGPLKMGNDYLALDCRVQFQLWRWDPCPGIYRRPQAFSRAINFLKVLDLYLSMKFK